MMAGCSGGNQSHLLIGSKIWSLPSVLHHSSPEHVHVLVPVHHKLMLTSTHSHVGGLHPAETLRNLCAQCVHSAPTKPPKRVTRCSTGRRLAAGQGHPAEMHWCGGACHPQPPPYASLPCWGACRCTSARQTCRHGWQYALGRGPMKCSQVRRHPGQAPAHQGSAGRCPCL